MKKYFFILIAVGLFFFGLQAAPAHATSWTYYRSITVTSTNTVASGTNTNFPMLVSSTLTSWKSSGHSGDIQNLVTAPNGGQEPADLVFATSSANCTAGSYLNFETESYNSSTGALVDWVNVPSMSTGTVIYACYDAAAVTTDQTHPSSTWNSSYGAVYHLGNSSGLNLKDSTLNAATLTNNVGVSGTTGQVDGAASFSGSNELDATGNANTDVGNNTTLEAWLYATSQSNGDNDIITSYTGCGAYNYFFYTLSGTFAYYDCSAQNTLGATMPLNTWTDAVLTISGTTGKLYINGNLTSTTTLAAGGGSSDSSVPFDIGSYGDGSGEYWQGTIDEARMSSVVRSASWILTEYNNQSSPSTFYALGSETSFGGGGAPVISNVTSTEATSTATITWTTNVSADSLVNYGTSTTYTVSSTYSATYVTSHSVNLTGLTPNTTYDYQAVSSNGTLATSSNYTFTTTSSGGGSTVNCGETSQASTDNGNAGYTFATPCVTGTSTTGYAVSQIYYWVGTTAATTESVGVYTDSSNDPNTLLCSATTSTTPATNSWNSMNISGCGTLSSSTQYWVANLSQSNTVEEGWVSGNCPGTSINSINDNNGGDSSLPSPLTSPDSITGRCYSFYMVLSNASSSGGGGGSTQTANGNIWVADAYNDRVQEFSPTGTYIGQLGCGGSGGCADSSSNGYFSAPVGGVAVDASGNVWVGDGGGYRVEEFSATGTYEGQFGTYGGSNGQFVSIYGITTDSNGDVWVADDGDDRVEEFVASGTSYVYKTEVGCGGSGSCADSTTNGYFHGPWDMAFDPNGNLWVVDNENNRVEEFSASGTTYAYKQQIGCASGACTASSTNGMFSSPRGIEFDSTGNMWVEDDLNNRVEKFIASGTTYAYSSQVGSAGSGPGQWYTTNGFGIDSTGNIWMTDSDNHRVDEVSATGTYVNQLGCSSGICGTGSANGEFSSNSPHFLAIAGGGYTNISASSSQHWAWNDSIGWSDWYDTDSVVVSSAKLTGYASSSAGYISVDCGTSPSGNICGTSNYGITNDGNGNLAGWAWNDVYGWISFCGNSSGGSTLSGSSWVCPSSPTYQVVINPLTGVFTGWAWNDKVGWVLFNCSNTSTCGTSQYDVVTSWRATGTNATGTLDSETFDTGVTSGAQLNSVTWQGGQPSNTAVSFQFAVSASSTGPWTFVGPDGTSASVYTGLAGIPITLTDYPVLKGRYFRYQIILSTNSTGSATPQVTGVVVNWSK